MTRKRKTSNSNPPPNGGFSVVRRMELNDSKSNTHDVWRRALGRPHFAGATMSAGDMKRNSRSITDGPSRAPARSMLKAVGFTDEDLQKPIIGVANTWIEI